MAHHAIPVPNKAVLHHYLTLPEPEDKIVATYIWFHEKILSKTRTLSNLPTPTKLEDIPIWDAGVLKPPKGCKYAQIYLQPVAIYKDPFLRGKNLLVLCVGLNEDKTPTECNKRQTCLEALERAKHTKPWFGLEQEYILLGLDKRPFGWPLNGFPSSEIRHCGVGTDAVCGRDIADAHYLACLYAGIKICGTNAEAMLSQWEYQIGPCEGISIGDEVWMSRYILLRIAEDFGALVSFDPKPVEGKWFSSGAHMNFSTEAMRENGGIKEIERAVEKLRKTHDRHMMFYDQKKGEDNLRRLTGDPSHFYQFTSGVANRYVSVRIPLHCALEKKGYLEDRRPAANCDPYSVVEEIVKTTVLNE
ncbi:hypothetical protein WA026_020960 [Henosepilachna vigintioctopunctata]|uniref:glutamine synthetase n=1 Tax=Henosepilachna vigintioctopunctata TaxID=420089 RepID=A0AAW1VB26_9CUCU